MKKATLSIVLAAAALAGCAGVDSNTAYVKAHEAQARTRTAEVAARAKSEDAITNAMVAAAAGCTTDGCRGMSLVALAGLRNGNAGGPITAAAPIAPPVNEALEGVKFVAKTVVDLYSLRLGLIKFGIDATRGPADTATVRDGFNYTDIIRTAP